jgi:integrase
VESRFSRFAERAGLPDRGFHCFRHTVITERLARGVPLQAVSRLAGHSSVAVTDSRYNHADALAYSKYIEREELA